MNYEKKYKEALEDMRAIYPNLKGDAKLAVEHAFPELCESEDERIIRAINNMLPFNPDNAYANNGVTKEQVLAWLEKQKEQMNALEKAIIKAHSTDEIPILTKLRQQLKKLI